MSNSHVVLAGSERPQRQDAERIGDVDPSSPIELTLSIRPAKPLPERSLPCEIPPPSGPSPTSRSKKVPRELLRWKRCSRPRALLKPTRLCVASFNRVTRPSDPSRGAC